MVVKETELNGHEHPDTAGASCQLARVLLERGELDAATPLLHDAMRLLNLPLPDSVAPPEAAAAAAAAREPAEPPASPPKAAESFASPPPKAVGSSQVSSPTTSVGGGVLSPSARRRRVSSVERSPGVAGSSVLRSSLNVRSSGALRSVVGGDDDGESDETSSASASARINAEAAAAAGPAGAGGRADHARVAAGVARDGEMEKEKDTGEGNSTAMMMAPYAHHQCLAMASMGRLLMLRGDTTAAMPMLVRCVRSPQPTSHPLSAPSRAHTRATTTKPKCNQSRNHKNEKAS